MEFVSLLHSWTLGLLWVEVDCLFWNQTRMLTTLAHLQETEHVALYSQMKLLNVIVLPTAHFGRL